MDQNRDPSPATHWEAEELKIQHRRRDLVDVAKELLEKGDHELRHVLVQYYTFLYEPA